MFKFVVVFAACLACASAGVLHQTALAAPAVAYANSPLYAAGGSSQIDVRHNYDGTLSSYTTTPFGYAGPYSSRYLAGAPASYAVAPASYAAPHTAFAAPHTAFAAPPTAFAAVPGVLPAPAKYVTPAGVATPFAAAAPFESPYSAHYASPYAANYASPFAAQYASPYASYANAAYAAAAGQVVV